MAERIKSALAIVHAYERSEPRASAYRRALRIVSLTESEREILARALLLTPAEIAATRVPKTTTTAQTTDHGTLMTYDTAETLRRATAEERAASIEAAKRDGGAGVVLVDGRSCYVEG